MKSWERTSKGREEEAGGEKCVVPVHSQRCREDTCFSLGYLRLRPLVEGAQLVGAGSVVLGCEDKNISGPVGWYVADKVQVSHSLSWRGQQPVHHACRSS